jgi:tetratricopeptide (TPR) repeat protein
MKSKFLLIVSMLLISVICKSQGNALSLADTSYFKGEWQKAISYYKKALADTSTSALLWQRLAYSNYMSKNYDDALMFYKKSLSFKPNPVLSGIIYSNILNIYEAQNKPGEAIDFLKQAADKGFNNLALVDTAAFLSSFKNDENFKSVENKIRLNAYPCLSQPHGNDFDFWIGEWDVYITGTNNLIGKSKITKVNGGCVILENWTSLVSPQTGVSMNFIDPVSGKWMQDYAGSGGGRQLYTDGEYTDSAMRFVYEGTFNNSTFPGHFIFYNEGPDKVRQYNDYSKDDGKTFITAYDYTYRRRK